MQQAAVGRTRQFWPRLGAIVALAAAWRLLYVHFEGRLKIISDEFWYITEAKRLFTSIAWTSPFPPLRPTAEHGPLTSILFAPLAWADPSTDVLRSGMALLGAVTVLLIGLVARELGGERCGLVAAAAAAAFPDLWIRDGLVVSEPIATLFLVLAVWVTVRARREPRARHFALLGLLAGLVCLARPELVLAIVGLMAGLALIGRSRATLLHLGLGAVAAAALVIPWSAYNAGRFKDTVLVSNNLGITLAGANCQRTYERYALMGYVSPLCSIRADAKAAKRSPDESVQSAAMRSEALHYVEHHLDRVPLVVAMREVWLLGLYRPGWVVNIGTKGSQPSWATWIQAIAFYPYFAGALVLWWRGRRQRWPNWLLAVLIVNAFVIAGVFDGTWRYRVSLDVGVVFLIGLGAASRAPSDGDAHRALAER